MRLIKVDLPLPVEPIIAVVDPGLVLKDIFDADNIIVLNEGKCVGQGTHAELLSSCEVYQDIVKSQLDKDEVEKTIKMVKDIEKGGN